MTNREVIASPVGGVVLLYDDACALCSRTVRLVLERDHAGAMRFAPLHSAPGRAVLTRHPELLGVDSVVVVDTDPVLGERAWTRWDAVVAIAHHLGGGWRYAARVVARVVPRALGDWAYDLVARRRSRRAARPDRCPALAPEHRARFIA